MQSFNSVPPPPAAPVDPNSAFADALKRAKEVAMPLRSLNCVLICEFNKNFAFRLLHVWDRVALPQLRLRSNKV